MSHPAGDPELSAEYFKKAGYASGKYEGDDELLMVGTSEGVAQKAAEVAKENFEKMGFKINLRLVTQDAMYTKFCNSPPAKVAICPNVGWLKDFSDAQTYLDPTFNGDNILQTGNSNWPQLDDPALNKQMNEAKLLTDPAGAGHAWAEIDKELTELAPADQLGLGQDPADPLRERERCAERLQRPVGPRLHVDQVVIHPEGPATHVAGPRRAF